MRHIYCVTLLSDNVLSRSVHQLGDFVTRPAVTRSTDLRRFQK